MKAAALFLFASVALGQASCTYRQAEDIMVSMCTLSDGSGLETFESTSGISESRYTPEHWAERLKFVADADARHAEDLRKIREHIAAMETAAHIANKKACKAAGYSWTGGACFAKD